MIFTEKESSTLEFKQELPKNNQIVKTIIGFANQLSKNPLMSISTICLFRACVFYHAFDGLMTVTT